MWTKHEVRQLMTSFVEAVPGGRFEVCVVCASDEVLQAIEITRGAECSAERVLEWLESYFYWSAASAHRMTRDADRIRFDRMGLLSEPRLWLGVR